LVVLNGEERELAADELDQWAVEYVELWIDGDAGKEWWFQGKILEANIGERVPSQDQQRTGRR